MARATRLTATRPAMKALAPYAVAAASEVVAGAESLVGVTVEVADEVGIPVPVLETVKVTPCETRKDVSMSAESN